MALRAFAKVLLAVLLLGCGPAFDEWRGDSTFTPEERSAIIRGYAFTAERMDQTMLPIKWNLGHDPSVCLSGQICRRDALPRGIPGMYGDGRMWLAPSATPQLHVVSAHEFGHYFGLGHHSARGLMSATADRSGLEWTEADEELKENE